MDKDFFGRFWFRLLARLSRERWSTGQDIFQPFFYSLLKLLVVIKSCSPICSYLGVLNKFNGRSLITMLPISILIDTFESYDNGSHDFRSHC